MAFANAETAREYYARYRIENKDAIRAKEKAFREANKERLKVSQRQYRQANHAVILARQKAYRDSEAGKQYHAEYISRYLGDPSRRMAFLAKGAIRRAKKLGIVYNVGIVEHLSTNPPQTCPCCQRELNYEIGKGLNVRDDSPSIDRFICANGYTVENVRIICMRCNSLKRDGTIQELQAILKYMQS